MSQHLQRFFRKNAQGKLKPLYEFANFGYTYQIAERWLSGRRHVPAKDAYPFKGTEGSNPSLSEIKYLAYWV